MKTIAVIILILTSSILIGLPFQNGLANNLKAGSLEPIWGKSISKTDTDPNIQHDGGYSIKAIYIFPVYRGDNITINTTVANSFSQIWFGDEGGVDFQMTVTLPIPSFFFISASTDATAIRGYIDTTDHFWIVPETDQIMVIAIRQYSAGSITYSINKINATPTQDPAIKVLQNQVNDLQTNLTNAQIQTYYLKQQINALNTTINNMNNTQNQMLVNITNLWIAFDKLNDSLTDLTQMVNDLNTSLNVSQNLSWIEQNLTQINTNLLSIQDMIIVLSKDKAKIKQAQDQLNDTLDNITTINNNISVIKNSIPKAYNDTALKNRVAQLEYENNKLNDDLKRINKKQEQASNQRGDDFRVVTLALIIGIVGILFGVFALIFAPISRMPKGLEKEDLDETPNSKDYDEVEEKPKAIPKAKAKKKDNEDLDDVMSKLKE